MIIVFVAGFLANYISPWWSISLTAILSAFFLKLKSGTAFLFGLLGGFILWAMVAFYADIENQGILSTKIGSLFGGIGSNALIVVTGILGGLFASIGSYIGASLRGLFIKSSKKGTKA